jgi:RHS repeat-associated protein
MNGQNLTRAFVPLPGGGGAAECNSSGLAYYRHADWLGSSRLASTVTAPTAMYSSTAYDPYGGPYAQAGTTDLSFTGQNSDIAGGLYDFPAREYSIQGRWPPPDPAGVAAVNPSDPQSWNRYAYARNSPLFVTDPTGTCNWFVNFFTDCDDDEGPSGPSPIKIASIAFSIGRAIATLNHGHAPVSLPRGPVNIPVPPYGTPPILLDPNGIAYQLTIWGPPDPKLIIVNLTIGGNGQPIGDYLNEYLLQCLNGACVGRFWNTYTNSWQSNPEPTIGMDIGHCPGCAQTLTNASVIVNTAFYATGAVIVGVPVAGEVGSSALGDFLLSRGTGILNSNNWLRVGWSWSGEADWGLLPRGSEILRISVGGPRAPIWWHIWP